MKPIHNILFTFDKPWAIQASGQLFPNSGGVVVAFSNCQLSIVNRTSSTFHPKFSALNSKFSFSQGFLYAPFGEITTEYNATFGNDIIPKYSFNAKELDEETGMYYYEARYYKPPVFTSRDPLFEKYPTFSPYIYCYNNPLRFIDPTGLYGYENIEEGQSYKVVAVFNSKYQDTKALGKEISEWRKAGCYQIANALQADYDAITSARQAGMPMMFVDNMDDYANAMNDFGAMGSSTDIYTLNSHGGNGEFNIGETKIDKYTNFSTLKNGLSDKTVFIKACNVTWGKEGKELIRHFSQQTSSTVIGKNSEISSLYWYNGGIGLNLLGNRFQMSTNGSDATEIRNVRINKNKGIIWKGSGGYH